MNREEKWRRWQAYCIALPYLEADVDDSLYCDISYRGHLLYRCTKRVFHVSYAGLFRVGGQCPFTAVEVRSNPLRYHSPRIKFENDDKPSWALLHYDSVEKRRERTADFWEAVEGCTEDISEWAWEGFTVALYLGRTGLSALRSLRLKRAWIDLRTYLGAKAWLNPEIQTTLARTIPTWSERAKAARLPPLRRILAGVLHGRLGWAWWSLGQRVKSSLLGRLWKGLQATNVLR